MGKKKKILIALAIICLIIAIAIPVCYYEVKISYNNLKVNTYDITDNKIKAGPTLYDVKPSEEVSVYKI